MSAQRERTLIFVRGFRERTRLIFLGAGVAAFMIFMLCELSKWKPRGPLEGIVYALGDELFITFGLFGLLCMVWGLFAPTWVERLLQRTFWKVTAVIALIGVASLLSISLFLIRR